MKSVFTLTFAEPVSHRRRGELRAVVAADVPRHAPRRHQPRQTLQHVIDRDPPGHVDRQMPALNRRGFTDLEFGERGTTGQTERLFGP
jgi:hypothetical protein